MDKKVLIIAYYWPPSGGSGVQRWLKFVKYLPEFGWKPFVFTPENPAFDIKDPSLLKDVPADAEVIHFPIWEPYELFSRLSSFFGPRKKGDTLADVPGKAPTVFQKITTWIRGNLFIPDPRIFWVRPSVRFLGDFLRDNDIRTIITTGPPHSVHLIGYNLKKKNPGIRWLADFRDPWSEWGFLDSLHAGSFARAVHRKMEARVLRSADRVITITPFYVRQFEKLSKRKVDLLTNGYDHVDFENLSVEPTEKFIIRHVGIVNEKCDPRPFMRAIGELASSDEEFRSAVQVDFVGEVNSQFKAFVRASPDIALLTTFTPPVPHSELMTLYGRSSVLLIVLTGYKDAEGYMPGKLFEYLATGIPIAGTGPVEGDASNLLREAGAGGLIEGTDPDGIKTRVMELFNDWRNARVDLSRKAGLKYSRRAITRQLTALL